MSPFADHWFGIVSHNNFPSSIFVRTVHQKIHTHTQFADFSHESNSSPDMSLNQHDLSAPIYLYICAFCDEPKPNILVFGISHTHTHNAVAVAQIYVLLFLIIHTTHTPILFSFRIIIIIIRLVSTAVHRKLQCNLYFCLLITTYYI